MQEQSNVDQGYIPFRLVSASKISQDTKVVLSTVKTWGKSKPERIRLMEYAVYFSVLDEAEALGLLSPEITFHNAIKLIGGGTVILKELSEVSGVSLNTLHNWWTGDEDKRVLVVSICLAAMSMIFIAKNSKLSCYWAVTEFEVELSNKVVTVEVLANNIIAKAVCLWKRELVL